MKIYTKGGDKGTTSLIGGKRVLKSDLRVEAYGSVDELVSFVGVIRSYEIAPHYQQTLMQIQDRLMVVAALLAADEDNKKKLPQIEASDSEILETAIDTMVNAMPALNSFILPGGNLPAAFCHVSCGVCRRAERAAVRLSQESLVSQEALIYLNRLSDYLYTLGRKIAHDASNKEELWIPKV